MSWSKHDFSLSVSLGSEKLTRWHISVRDFLLAIFSAQGNGYKKGVDNTRTPPTCLQVVETHSKGVDTHWLWCFGTCGCGIVEPWLLTFADENYRSNVMEMFGSFPKFCSIKFKRTWTFNWAPKIKCWCFLLVTTVEPAALAISCRCIVATYVGQHFDYYYYVWAHGFFSVGK